VEYIKHGRLLPVLLIAGIVLIVAIGFSYHFVYKMIRNERKLLILYCNDLMINTAKAKLGSFVEKIHENCNETIARKLCERLLRLNVMLPCLVLLEGNSVHAVIIGIPSEKMWERILGRLSQKGAFLAFSVKEELLQWRCATCPSQGRLVEDIWDLSEEEAQSILEIISIRS